jgi:hypothetical protein
MDLLAYSALRGYSAKVGDHAPLVLEMLKSTRARRLEKAAKLREAKFQREWDEQCAATEANIRANIAGDLADPLNLRGDGGRENRILQAWEERKSAFEDRSAEASKWYQRFNRSQNHVPLCCDREKIALHASGILVLDYSHSTCQMIGEAGIAVLVAYTSVDQKAGGRLRLCSVYCGYEPTYRRAIELGRSVWHRHTMPYDEYLKTDHWQAVRQEAIRNAAGRCEGCATPDGLQVHHRSYVRRGFEDVKLDLRAFCGRCHGNLHGKF